MLNERIQKVLEQQATPYDIAEVLLKSFAI
jgi:hypothetical protein